MASTLVGSENDSEAGTPLAISPAPLDDVPLTPKEPTTSPPNHRSVGVQGPETPIYAARLESEEMGQTPTSPDGTQTGTLQIVFKEGEKVDVIHPPTPAKRTILRKIENREVGKMVFC